MSTVSAEIRYDPKDDAWFTANATMVLKNGEPAIHVTTGLYKMGDDSTQLQNLPWLPVISGGTWGSITGDIPDQTDLVDYVQDQLNLVIRDMGVWDASGGLFPTTGGSGSGGAIEAGNQFRISVDGTLAGIPVTQPYSYIRALYDAPGQDGTKWYIVPASAPVPSPTSNRKILLYQNTNSSVTGTLSETILTPNTWLIAGGTMGLNSILWIPAYMQKIGTAGACTWSIKINTSYSLVGAVTLHTSGSAWTTTTRSGGFSDVRLVNKNSLSSQVASSISSSGFNTFSTNDATALTVNTANNFYIMITAQLANTGDTARLNNAQVYIDNP